MKTNLLLKIYSVPENDNTIKTNMEFVWIGQWFKFSEQFSNVFLCEFWVIALIIKRPVCNELELGFFHAFDEFVNIHKSLWNRFLRKWHFDKDALIPESKLRTFKVLDVLVFNYFVFFDFDIRPVLEHIKDSLSIEQQKPEVTASSNASEQSNEVVEEINVIVQTQVTEESVNLLSL